ncbi:hypothetical protein [Streptomyces sp. SID13726]|uniref:hypothetical protein n=1 Tax=Streptomyces sp. SID13726 TaxID=2706058 RepID=UPI0013B9EAE7|nr:hypothetical protein [Streptomyces sp. SID13726]NEB01967.1 hypothetical protein [Streptomyces sp. SID13726]
MHIRSRRRQAPTSRAAPPTSSLSPVHRTDLESAISHPDFELYDNVGRTSEQIRAHRTGSATSGDLHRWAERDAAAFRTAHPLSAPSMPAPDLSPYREALGAADSAAEFSAALNALLDAVEPFLAEVIDHLALAARWKNQNRGAEPGSPPWLLRDAASRISSALAMAAEADLTILRAHYDPPPDHFGLLKQPPVPGAPAAPTGPQHGSSGPRP